MTEKERFEQIKETWLALGMNPPTPILKVAKMDIDWLIQRFEDLTDDVIGYHMKLTDLKNEIEQLKKELKPYKNPEHDID